MLLRVFAVALTLVATTPSTDVAALDPTAAAVMLVTSASPDDTTPTQDTINEFFPEERSLGDCLSSLPKPGCGSEAHGGWRQGLVLGAILLGLGFIAWRVVRQSRKARS